MAAGITSLTLTEVGVEDSHARRVVRRGARRRDPPRAKAVQPKLERLPAHRRRARARSRQSSTTRRARSGATSAGRCTACRSRTRTCITGRAWSSTCGSESARRAGSQSIPRPRLSASMRRGAIELGVPQHGRVRLRPDRLQPALSATAAIRGTPTHITGGSSSGSGVGGGRPHCATPRSAPTPAARSACRPRVCGVVGLMPTYGRVSRAARCRCSFSLDTVGPLARSGAPTARCCCA